MAPSNDTVDRLNQRAQQRRIIAGELDPDRFAETTDGVRLHIGDVIATRRNDRSIETDRHEMVRNRNTFTITYLYDDGSIAAVGDTGWVILPNRYVADHVELGQGFRDGVVQNLRMLLVETSAKPSVEEVLRRARARVTTTGSRVDSAATLAARDADRR